VAGRVRKIGAGAAARRDKAGAGAGAPWCGGGKRRPMRIGENSAFLYKLCMSW
jgi:hypothetical protein